MRELEFLPGWYNQLQLQRRIVRYESWLFAIVAIAMGAWMLVANHTTNSTQAALGSVKTQLAKLYDEKKVLADQLKLKQELTAREQIVAALGVPVDMTRLLQTVDDTMPKEMSLTDFSCETAEQVKRSTSVAALRTGEQSEVTERVLKVKLAGVSPSDVDLANFLAGLTNQTVFQNVSYTYSRDKSEAGHVMREFEVTFSMNLTQAGGN